MELLLGLINLFANTPIPFSVSKTKKLILERNPYPKYFGTDIVFLFSSLHIRNFIHRIVGINKLIFPIFGHPFFISTGYNTIAKGDGPKAFAHLFSILNEIRNRVKMFEMKRKRKRKEIKLLC